jgi:predicted AAA+ superfamily ATPase
VVRRVADQWRPASAQESFEIVRRRLFEEPTAAAHADISAVARQFMHFYTRHTGEFPREVIDPAYEARIRAAYPLHPELFDRLYEDWSTLDRFQRTRGVLRLMSAVVHTLWVAQDSGPMILPGTVPLDVTTVASEITQYLPDSWKPIIDTDIDGPASTPIKVDTDRPILGARAVTRRLARAIFIGSAPTLRSAHRGVERQRIWLGTAVPGDTVGNFGSALDLLSQRAT